MEATGDPIKNKVYYLCVFDKGKDKRKHVCRQELTTREDPVGQRGTE